MIQHREWAKEKCDQIKSSMPNLFTYAKDWPIINSDFLYSPVQSLSYVIDEVIYHFYQNLFGVYFFYKLCRPVME